MSPSTLAGQLRGIFGRRLRQPAAAQPACPWFGVVDANRLALKDLSPSELLDYAGPVFAEGNLAELSGLASADYVANAIDTGGRHICLVLAQLATYLDVFEDGDFSIDR